MMTGVIISLMYRAAQTPIGFLDGQHCHAVSCLLALLYLLG
jgi:hypothetical protein